MASATEQDYLKVHVTYDEPGSIGGESMWAKYTDVHGNVEIANIPFFTDDFTMGDVVRVEFSDDQLPEIVEIVKRSGNTTVYAHFVEGTDDEVVDIVNDVIRVFDAKAEKAIDRMYAFCVSESVADDVTKHLLGTGFVSE